MVLRVVTFNIRHGEALSGRIDLKAQAELLRSLEADVVFLQEVDSGTDRSGGIDQAKTLAQLAGFPFSAFGRCRDCLGGGYGNAILSRFQPLEVVNTLIPTRDPDRPRPWRDGSSIYLEQRGILRMSVEVEGDPVHLLCTHFGFMDEERPDSARLLLELIARLPSVVVAGGDLNAPDDDSEELMLLRSALTDCALASGQSLARTFPADDPRLRLDYLFVRGGYTPAAVTVAPTLTSDHRPLLADLMMAPRPVLSIPVPTAQAEPLGTRPVATPAQGLG